MGFSMGFSQSQLAPLDKNVTICQKREYGKSVDRNLTNFLTIQMQVPIIVVDIGNSLANIWQMTKPWQIIDKNMKSYFIDN